MLSPGRDGAWLVELEIAMPALEPERLVAECEGFLVDFPDGRGIGVVEQIEIEVGTGRPVALVVAAGWFGRRKVRVDVGAIEALVPAERRVIVREAVPLRPGTGARRP